MHYLDYIKRTLNESNSDIEKIYMIYSKGGNKEDVIKILNDVATRREFIKSIIKNDQDELFDYIESIYPTVWNKITNDPDIINFLVDYLKKHPTLMNYIHFMPVFAVRNLIKDSKFFKAFVDALNEQHPNDIEHNIRMFDSKDKELIKKHLDRI